MIPIFLKFLRILYFLKYMLTISKLNEFFNKIILKI